MFELDEFVVHPGQGVCRVADLPAEPDGVYKLEPVGQRHPMLISFPAASEGRLRRIISAKAARALIKSYPEIEPDPHTDRSAALEEGYFKEVLKEGGCEDAVRVVKTFRKRIAEVRSRNKKPPVAYERILKQASERSLSELAIALGTTPDDVRMLFESQDGEDVSAN